MVRHEIKDKDEDIKTIKWNLKVDDSGKLKLYGNNGLILTISTHGTLTRHTDSSFVSGLRVNVFGEIALENDRGFGARFGRSDELE